MKSSWLNLPESSPLKLNSVWAEIVEDFVSLFGMSKMLQLIIIYPFKRLRNYELRTENLSEVQNGRSQVAKVDGP